MNFTEAMKAMKDGQKVTRKSWVGSVYFKCINPNANANVIHAYQPKLAIYQYNESIMLSSGWQVEGVEGEFDFCDIIDHLKSGKKVKQHDWNEDTYIKYDHESNALVCFSMEMLPFTPNFEDFTATDWVTV